MCSPYSIRQVTGNDLAGLSNLTQRPMSQEALFTNIGIARTRDVHIPYQTIEATPGIEIHENRHPQSGLALNSQIVTRVQRPRSHLSPSFPKSVHGVVPNPYHFKMCNTDS